MPKVIWLTGLSNSGKTTIGRGVVAKLNNLNKRAILIDGDDIRTHICSDLGFCPEDRSENIRRAVGIAQLLLSQDLWVVVALISPYSHMRQYARNIFGEQFIEVYIKASLETCESRDTNGLYKKAKAGELKHFTGITDTYEVPDTPDVIIDSDNQNLENCVKSVMMAIK